MDERTDSTLSRSLSISLVLTMSSVSTDRLACSRKDTPTSAKRPSSRLWRG